MVTKTWERRIVSWNSANTWAPDGSLELITMVGVDVTDHKRAQEALERSSGYALTLFEKFPAIIWRSDAEGLCDYVNEAWRRFTGLGFDSGVGDGISAVVHPRMSRRSIASPGTPSARNARMSSSAGCAGMTVSTAGCG